MKKLSRSQIQNLLFLAFIIILLFTPLGKQIKVYVNRWIAFSPSVEDVSERKVLSATDYQWRLVNEEGNVVSLQQYKGDVVLINFWATWCPPCIAEMPELQELYDTYKDRVVFLFVTSDDFPKTTAFKNKDRYTFPVFRYISELPESLNHSTIPTTYLIDKKGAIVIDKNGAAAWNSSKVHQTIDGLLQE